jgi:hypothetical protein
MFSFIQMDVSGAAGGFALSITLSGLMDNVTAVIYVRANQYT